MADFIDELKRRKVFRVGASYLVVAWLLLQLTDLVFENLNAPDWVMQAIMLVLLLGFPVALVLAWAFEVQPDGVATDSAGSPANTRKFYALVGIAVLAAIGVYTWQKAGLQISEPAPPQSAAPSDQDESLLAIAVLPFESLSEDSEDQYFADGLADTLLHKLAQLQTLRVIARNSSFQFKGQNVDVREIGTELGVPTILEGTVQRQGDQVRVIAQLVSTADGSHWWSGTFDGSFDDIFDLQDRIAAAIATQLQITLSEQDRDRLYRDGTVVPAAYDALSRSRAIDLDFDAASFDPDDNQRLNLIREALALDPNYALAWARLSSYYNSLAFYDTDSSRFEEFVAESLEAARRAIEVDPGNAEGYVRLGFGHWRLQQRAQAEEAYRTALAIDPNQVDALAGLGLIVADRNPQEAYELFSRSQQIDPASVIVHRQLFFTLLAMGRFDEAVTQLRLGIDKAPDFFLLYKDLADAYSSGFGRYDEAAMAASELLRRDSSSPAAQLEMTKAWLAVDDTVRAENWLDELQRKQPEDIDVQRRSVELLLRQGNVEAAVEVAEAIPARGFAVLHRSSVLIELCMTLGDRDCAVENLLPMESFLENFQARGGDLPVGVEAVFELYRGWLSYPDTDSGIASLERAADLYSRFPLLDASSFSGEFRGYSRAEALTLLGRHDEAVAELQSTLELADGGFVAGGIDNLSPERSVILVQLNEHPGFERWAETLIARRSSMRQRMVELERDGAIVAAP